MEEYDIHLVGSVPLQSAAAVFETVSRYLGPKLLRLPDGETGVRSHWLGWQEPTFSQHSALEKTDRLWRPHAAGDLTPLHRLKPGFAIRDLTFDNLRIAENAIASYADFSRLKNEGKIPAHIRFQVSIANPLAVVERFVAKESEDSVFGAYENALLQEIDKIAAAIPHDQLAIQWDIASRIIASLEIGKPTRFGDTRADMLATFSALTIRWGNAVPSDVELLFHLCYGDNAHRHVVEPASLDIPVDFANAISAGIGRSIQLIHMPVPRGRMDDAYFAPLKRLTLQPETRICLGLIHYTDGVEGTRRRIAVAHKYLDDFLVSTECGFGRRPPETIAELLRIYAEIAGLPAQA